MPLCIETNEISFSYGKFEALKNVSVNVPYKSIYGFLGPNGAGKTTTIRLILNLLKPGKGNITLFGKNLQKHVPGIFSNIGAMIEEPSLYKHLSARENLNITATLRNVQKNRIEEVLKIVKLTRDADRPVKQFSTGMKQRLGLALALLPDPELLILDEPTNGLDPLGIIEMRELIIKLNREHHKTIFLSSHLLSEIEKLCSHTSIIHQGKLVFQGNIKEMDSLRKHSANLIIDTGQPEKVRQILSEKFQKTCEIQSDQTLETPYVSKEENALIIKECIEKELDIFSVSIRKSNLEEMFLSITKNDTDHV